MNTNFTNFTLSKMFLNFKTLYKARLCVGVIKTSPWVDHDLPKYKRIQFITFIFFQMARLLINIVLIVKTVTLNLKQEIN